LNLKTPTGFRNKAREAEQREREQERQKALLRSHDVLLAHPELMAIDMISSDEEEDDDDAAEESDSVATEESKHTTSPPHRINSSSNPASFNIRNIRGCCTY
jgi:nitric oxide reductase activation protein